MPFEFEAPFGLTPQLQFLIDSIRRALEQFDQTHVKYLRRDFTKADDGSTIDLGGIPANSLVLKPLSGVHVVEAFNAATTNVLDVGTLADGDLLGTDLALGTVGFVPLDENIGGYRFDADTGLTFTVDLTGTAATTGKGAVVIAYVTLPAAE